MRLGGPGELRTQRGPALSAVGATHLASQNFRQLSGGEPQLVWLARLSLHDAPLYLLNEPTQQARCVPSGFILALLRQWVTAEDHTILCSTHYLDSLPGMPGFLLNVPRPQPQLVPISAGAGRAGVFGAKPAPGLTWPRGASHQAGSAFLHGCCPAPRPRHRALETARCARH